MGSRNSSTEKDRSARFSVGPVFLILLTVWALAMIAPGLQRVIDSLGSFGLSVANDGNITDAVAPFPSPAESPASIADIVPRDRIDLKAMRCIPINLKAEISALRNSVKTEIAKK
jgi:hypothetical protein